MKYRQIIVLIIGVSLITTVLVSLVMGGITGNVITGKASAPITEVISDGKTTAFTFNGDKYHIAVPEGGFNNVTNTVIFWAKNVRIDVPRKFELSVGESVIFDSSNILDKVTIPLEVNLLSIGTCWDLFRGNYPCGKVTISEVINEIPSEITYMDPTDCEFVQVFQNENSSEEHLRFVCSNTQFVGRVTHIVCPYNFKDERIVVGSAWISDSLPLEIDYSCQSSETGNLASPTTIFGYCCNIKGQEIATKSSEELHRTSTSPSGIPTQIF